MEYFDIAYKVFNVHVIIKKQEKKKEKCMLHAVLLLNPERLCIWMYVTVLLINPERECTWI